MYTVSEVRAHCRITGNPGNRNIAISAPCFANNGERIFKGILFYRFHTGGEEMRNIFRKAKRKTAWRTLSLLLTLSLILGMISVSAYAALVPGETDQPAETGTETGAETDIFVPGDNAGGFASLEEEAFSEEGVLSDTQTFCAITLDAGPEGYFIDENGDYNQTIVFSAAEGQIVSNLLNPLPVPVTDSDALFLGWSLLEDRSELIPEEGFAAQNDITVYAVWDSGQAENSEILEDQENAGETGEQLPEAQENAGEIGEQIPEDQEQIPGDEDAWTAPEGTQENAEETGEQVPENQEQIPADEDAWTVPEEDQSGEIEGQVPEDQENQIPGQENVQAGGQGIETGEDLQNQTESDTPDDTEPGTEVGTQVPEEGSDADANLSADANQSVDAGQDPAADQGDEEGISDDGGQEAVSEGAMAGSEDSVECTVTFDANGGTFEEGKSTLKEKIRQGRRIWFDDIDEPEKDKCVFLGWTTVKNNKDTLLDEYIRVEKNTTLYAYWAVYRTVRFDANGGYYRENRRRTSVWSEIIRNGKTIDLDDYEPDYDGDAEFKGWSLQRDGTPLTSHRYTVKSNVTLYALWVCDLEDGDVRLSKTSYVYNGKKICPGVTVTYDDKKLTKGTDYTVAYSRNINVGTAYATITGKGKYEGRVRRSFKITRAAQSLTLKAGASRLAVARTTVVTAGGARETKKYTFKSSNTKIAAVTSAGKVRAKKVGTVKIRVSTPQTANYKAGSRYITIKVVPGVTNKLTAVNQKNGVRLTWTRVTGANGYIIYRDGKKIKTISKGSTLTYTDTKANKNGRRYTYKLVAKASTGNSTLSRTVKITRSGATGSSSSSSSSGTSTGSSGTSSGSSTGSQTGTAPSSSSGSTGFRVCFETKYVASTLNKCTKNQLAVIETDGVSTSVIKAAVSRGVKVYGYLNAGALESERSYFSTYQHLILAEYDGWDGEYWVNVTAASWKNHLISEAKKIKAAGATGIYFDNTDILWMVEEGFRRDGTRMIRTAPSAGNVYKALADAVKTIQSEVGLRVMPNGGDTFVRRFVAENPGVLKEVITESVLYDGNSKMSSSDRKYLTNYLNWCIDQGIHVRGIEYINTTAGAREVLDYYEQQGWPEVYISKHKNLMGD